MLESFENERRPVDVFRALTAGVNLGPSRREIVDHIGPTIREALAQSRTNERRESRARSGRRTRQHQRTTPHDRGQRERAPLWVVGRVDPETALLTLIEDELIDVTIAGRRDDEPVTIEIGWFEPSKYESHVEVRELGQSVRRHHGDPRIASQQLLSLAKSDTTGAHDEDGTISQVEVDGERTHAPVFLIIKAPTVAPEDSSTRIADPH